MCVGSVLCLAFCFTLVIFDVAGDHGRFREIPGDRPLESEMQSPPSFAQALAFIVSASDSLFQCVWKGLQNPLHETLRTGGP